MGIVTRLALPTPVVVGLFHTLLNPFHILYSVRIDIVLDRSDRGELRGKV